MYTIYIVMHRNRAKIFIPNGAHRAKISVPLLLLFSLFVFLLVMPVFAAHNASVDPLPTDLTVDLVAGSDTGDSDSDDLTHDHTPTILVGRAAGLGSSYAVTVTAQRTAGTHPGLPSPTAEAVDDVVATRNDAGEVTLGTLSDGIWTISAQAVDSSSSTTIETTHDNLLEITITSQVIIPPSDENFLTVDLVAGSDTGDSDTDDITKDNTPTILVSSAIDLDASYAVTVTARQTDATDVVATRDGVGEVTLGTLSDGVWTISAEAVKSEAGTITTNAGVVIPVEEISAVSTRESLEITIIDLIIDLVAGSDTGISSTDDKTCDDTPTIHVSRAAGAGLDESYTVTVTARKTGLENVVATRAGAGEVTLGTLPNDGAWTISAKAVKGSSTITAYQPLVIHILHSLDSLECEINERFSLRLKHSSDTGSAGDDGITSDTTPTFAVYGAVPDAAVTVTARQSGATDVVATRTGVGEVTLGLIPLSQTAGDWNVTVSGATTVSSQTLSADNTFVYTAADADSDGEADTLAPTFSGQAPADSIVQFVLERDGYSVSVSTTAESGNTYSITVPLAEAINAADELEDGAWSVTAESVDILGDETTVVTATVQITIIANPAIAVDLKKDSDTGISAYDNVTFDVTPTFSIIGLTIPTDTVTVKATNGLKSVHKIVEGNSDFIFPNSFNIPSNEIGGDWKVKVSGATNVFDHTLNSDSVFTYTAPAVSFDRLQPDPTNTQTPLPPAEEGDTVPSGQRYPKPMFSGTAPVNAPIEFVFEKGRYSFTATAVADSGCQYVSNDAYSRCEYTIVAPLKNAIDLLSEENSDGIVIPGTIPSDQTGGNWNAVVSGATTVSSQTLSADTFGYNTFVYTATDAGNDGVADDLNPTFSGTAPAGSFVRFILRRNGYSVLFGDIASYSGRYSIDVPLENASSDSRSSFGAGVWSISAAGMDSAGNDLSADLDVTVVSVTPTRIPINLDPLAIERPDADVITRYVTPDTTPEFIITNFQSNTISQASIVASKNGSPTVSRSINSNGIFTLSDAPLAEGVWSVVFRYADSRTSLNSIEDRLFLEVTVDTGLVPPTFKLKTTSDTGEDDTDGLTSDTTPTFTIEGIPSETVVTVTAENIDDGSDAVTKSITGSGDVTLDLEDYKTYVVTARTLLGWNQEIEIGIDSFFYGPNISLHEYSDTGVSSTDGITNDSTPKITVAGLFAPTGTVTVTAAKADSSGENVVATRAGSGDVTLGVIPLSQTAGDWNAVVSGATTVSSQTLNADNTFVYTAADADSDGEADTLIPTFSGAAPVDSIVWFTLERDGYSVLFGTVVRADGTYSVVAPLEEAVNEESRLSDGLWFIFASGPDFSDNGAVFITETIKVTVVTEPALMLDLDEDSDTGADSSDYLTSDNTPTVILGGFIPDTTNLKLTARQSGSPDRILGSPSGSEFTVGAARSILEPKEKIGSVFCSFEWRVKTHGAITVSYGSGPTTHELTPEQGGKSSFTYHPASACSTGALSPVLTGTAVPGSLVAFTFTYNGYSITSVTTADASGSYSTNPIILADAGRSFVSHHLYHKVSHLIEPLADGVWSITAEAEADTGTNIDIAGNVITPVTIDISIDATAPTLVSLGTPDVSSREEVTLSLAATHNQHSSYANLPETVRPIFGGDCSDFAADTVWTDTTPADGQANTYVVTVSTSGSYDNCSVKLVDKAGNESRTLTFDEFTIKKRRSRSSGVARVGHGSSSGNSSFRAPTFFQHDTPEEERGTHRLVGDGSTIFARPFAFVQRGGNAGHFGSTTRDFINSIVAQRQSSQSFIPTQTPQTQTQTQTDTPVAFTRDLSVGSTGEDVRQLQTFLNQNGHLLAGTGPGSPGSETAYYGERTRAAEERYQRTHGIQPSVEYGHFGSTTRDFINSIVTQRQSSRSFIPTQTPPPSQQQQFFAPTVPTIPTIPTTPIIPPTPQQNDIPQTQPGQTPLQQRDNTPPASQQRTNQQDEEDDITEVIHLQLPVEYYGR